MRYLAVIIVDLIVCLSICIGQDLPFSRLDKKTIPENLAQAQEQWEQGRYAAAINELEKQIKTDTTLIRFIAVITGGNYHQLQLTDNIYADRVGGFSPSGKKLIYSRDTSVTRLDDGFFDWVEKSQSEIVYFDFEAHKEEIIKLPYNRCFFPKFQSDTSFFHIASHDSTGVDPPDKTLMIFSLATGISSICFPLRGYSYCPYENELIYYDWDEDAIIRFNPTNHNKTVLYSNSGPLNYRRPLNLIQNLSAGLDVIMFQAGSRATCIYSIPIEGGSPSISINQQLSYGSNSTFYPAAISSDEFAYLANTKQGIDVFYHFGEMDFRLTYDGGDKYYLAISADGSKIAYSFKPRNLYSESYDVFILGFGRDADISDIKYRFNQFK